ncbi:ABC transporter substrate-binding protein [Nonomuraea polychroma]|uniref:ABC transporter substrate-binding protein n=1 Tax=Nonomuraea polychroma TaxID=46176 RepID=UPI003D90D462
MRSLFLAACAVVAVASCTSAPTTSAANDNAGCPPVAAPSVTSRSPGVLTPVTFGAMPIPDSAPVHIAREEGYFAAEGLNVGTPVTIQGGGPAINQLKSGALDVTLVNYVAAFIAAQADPDAVCIIADAYQAAPGAFMLMTAKDSGIKTVADLKRSADGSVRIIAVATLRSISTLTTEMALAKEGISVKDVLFREMPLPQMTNALATGQVHAAWMTEPFASQWRRQGGVPLTDLMTGTAADWPIAGWAVSGDYARKHPDVVAAVQRALARGQQDATDRERLTKALGTYTQIPPEDAKKIALGVFPRSLDVSQLHSVATVMQQYGYLTKPVDVRQLVVPMAYWTSVGSPTAVPSPSVSPSASSPAVMPSPSVSASAVTSSPAGPSPSATPEASP